MKQEGTHLRRPLQNLEVHISTEVEVLVLSNQPWPRKGVISRAASPTTTNRPELSTTWSMCIAIQTGHFAHLSARLISFWSLLRLFKIKVLPFWTRLATYVVSQSENSSLSSLIFSSSLPCREFSLFRIGAIQTILRMLFPFIEYVCTWWSGPTLWISAPYNHWNLCCCI